MVVNRKITAMGTEVRVILDIDDDDVLGRCRDVAHEAASVAVLIITHLFRIFYRSHRPEL